MTVSAVLVETKAEFICKISFKEREPYFGDFIKCASTQKMGLCLDICGVISFKLGTVIDITKLYCFIPVVMTLIFFQNHWVMRKLELVQSFGCKVA